MASLQNQMQAHASADWFSTPLVSGNQYESKKGHLVYSPQDKSKKVGRVIEATEKDVIDAIEQAKTGFKSRCRSEVSTKLLN